MKWHQRKIKAPAYCRYGLIFWFLIPVFTFGQKTVVTDSSQPYQRTVIPGKEYKAGFFYRLLWGGHYRKEWTTPVTVPVLNVDTAWGGLTPIANGYHPEANILYLQNKEGKLWVLRTVNKDYSRALPPIAKGTFIQGIAKDQVSASFPFASLTIPVMAGAAGIYHTHPQLVFIPNTAGLGAYQEAFGHSLCIVDEVPQAQFYSTNVDTAHEVITTEELLKRVLEKSTNRVDQKAFVKARLFDMFLGDWSRNEAKWNWVGFGRGEQTIYQPLPIGRDMVYSRFDGFFPYLLTSPEQLESIEDFKDHIKNVKKINFTARYLDRLLANEASQQTWTEAANELQQSLTDAVIEKAIHQLPSEIFTISGNTLIQNLKARRDHLADYAQKYYKFLAEEVNVVGTPQNEEFQIKQLNKQETEISIHDRKANSTEAPAFYSRIFHSNHTEEIRVYGINGKDVYQVNGNAGAEIPVRIVGGPDHDSLINESTKGSKIYYYDDHQNFISGTAKLRLSSDSAVHAYHYKDYKYNSGHTIKFPFFTNTRGIHINLGYTYTKQQWRKEPFGWKQSVKFIYSFTNKAIGGEYEGIFNQALGKWNLLLNARYDAVLKNYFFGIGNNTKLLAANSFYQLPSAEGFASLGINRKLGAHYVGLSGFYQSIRINYDKDLFVSQVAPVNGQSIFDRKNFAGAEAVYLFHHVNNDLIPTNGIDFLATINHTRNVQETDRFFTRYTGAFVYYLPLGKWFSLAVKAGAATVTGEPELYQLNWLGGGQNLKGFHRQRFYGKTTFFDSNELRWITNTKNYFYNGKIGLLAFLDEGRVWQPGEASNKWHIGYGGGVLLAPFNKIVIKLYYGLSEDNKLVHLRLGRVF